MDQYTEKKELEKEYEARITDLRKTIENNQKEIHLLS
jgi:hypothetical protein